MMDRSSDKPGPLKLLAADIGANLDGDAVRGRNRVLTAFVKTLLTTRLQAVVLFRASQLLSEVFPPLSSVLKYINTVLTGADIAVSARVGPGLQLFHPTGVVIGPNCVVGARCIIQQGVTLGAGAGGSPTLGDDVFVGPGARVLGGIVLGDRCVLGANAVVLESMPDDVFIGGVPAKVIKHISDPHHLRGIMTK